MKYSDEQLIAMAVDIAKTSASNGGGPFGCVITRDGEIVATASNSVTLTNDPTAHAEVNAIRCACYDLKTFDLTGCTLYASCEPCPMCLSACYWAHIAKIYYSGTSRNASSVDFDDSFIYRELRKPVSERAIPMERICPDLGDDPFVIWKENSEKIEY
jgi:tRNA(Arg) A34 adenosine deaminase TadA